MPKLSPMPEPSEETVAEPGKIYGWKKDYPSEEVVNAFESGIIKPSDHVLDVGCGYGGNANWLAGKGCSMTAVNISTQELSHARAMAKKKGVNVDYIEADAAKPLPLKDNAFEFLLDMGCTHMLTKQGQETAAKEFARVLKDGACLLFYGFSKEHPKAKEQIARGEPTDPQFRDLHDIEEQFGHDFTIIEHQDSGWTDEQGNQFIGILTTMKRKPRPKAPNEQS